MQNAVRYYITRSDDQAVVRSVPVTKTARAIEPDAQDQPSQVTLVADRPAETIRRKRVARIVRAATRRGEDSGD